nr:exonuclease SbcC [Nakamurella leprariae]
MAPEDRRPRAALDAAQVFADGAPRSVLQRVTALDAHRAAREVADEVARLSARACGDAAAAAFLHPIARATQVGHILRSAACAARVAELRAGGDAAVATALLRSTGDRASPVVAAVLRRYPEAPTGRSRLSHLMVELDTLLRSLGPHRPDDARVPRCARPGGPE